MKFQWKTCPTFVLLLLTGAFTRCKGTSNVIYEDIESLNATCNGLDSCEVPRTNEPWKYNCNCDESCSFLRTCCVDSRYRQKYKQKYIQNIECRMLNNRRDFLYPWIRSCNPDLQYHKTTEELCTTRGIALGDPFKEIPVTDPETGITYQNYYCYACNENFGEERLIPWNVAIGGNLENVNKSSDVPNLHNYERGFWTWVADKDNGTHLSIWPAIPEELENTLPYCHGFKIVSECAPDWTDENVRKMCLSYMALTRIRNGTYQLFHRIIDTYSYYRNPHCAICNYESMDDMVCVAEHEEIHETAPGGLLPSGDFFVRLFSLHDERIHCRNKKVYDKFSKKCRNIYRARKRVQ